MPKSNRPEILSPNRSLSLIVNAENFKPYLIEHGMNRATAYYETLQDIVERTNQILIPPRPEFELIRNYYDDQEHSIHVRKGMKEFYLERFPLVNAVDRVFPMKRDVQYLTIAGQDYLQGYKDASLDMLQEYYYIFYKKDDFQNSRRGTVNVHLLLKEYLKEKTALLETMKPILENPDPILVPFS